MSISGRRFSVFAALFALIFVAGSPAAVANVDAAEVNKSIVWVDTEFTAVVSVPFNDEAGGVYEERYEAKAMGYCTGWFVSSDGHIATAGHCLEANRNTVVNFYDYVIRENQLDIGELRVENLEWDYSITNVIAYIGQPAAIEDGPLKGEERVAQIIEQQPFTNGDNALLKIANMTDTPALQIASSQPEVGQDVTSIGFAGSVARVVDLNRQPPSYKEGSVSSLSTSTSGVPHTEIDAAITQGMSGGPTLNEQGEVIGINSFGIVGESQPFNFVTDTSTMRTFLERNGVNMSANDPTDVATSGGVLNNPPAAPATDVVGSSNEADDGRSTLLTVILVILAVLIVVAVGVIAFLVKKSRSAQNKAPTNPPASS